MRYRQQITRSRVHGEDAPYGAWLRVQSRLASTSWVVTNSDYKMHKYLNTIDGQGSREIQCLMEVEVKSNGAYPGLSQIDTYWKFHSTINKHSRVNRQKVVNFGISFLRLQRQTPEDSDWMEWGRFNEEGQILWSRIDLQQHMNLIDFVIDPDKLTPYQFRRHHKTTKVLVHERTPLGFEAQRYLVNKS